MVTFILANNCQEIANFENLRIDLTFILVRLLIQHSHQTSGHMVSHAQVYPEVVRWPDVIMSTASCAYNTRLCLLE